MAKIDAIAIDNQSLRDAATGLGYRDKIPGPNVARQQADAATDQQVDAIVIQ